MRSTRCKCPRKVETLFLAAVVLLTPLTFLLQPLHALNPWLLPAGKYYRVGGEEILEIQRGNRLLYRSRFDRVILQGEVYIQLRNEWWILTELPWPGEPEKKISSTELTMEESNPDPLTIPPQKEEKKEPAEKENQKEKAAESFLYSKLQEGPITPPLQPGDRLIVIYYRDLLILKRLNEDGEERSYLFSRDIKRRFNTDS